MNRPTAVVPASGPRAPHARRALAAALLVALQALGLPSAGAAPFLELRAGTTGNEGNLDGPLATATWGSAPSLTRDGDGFLATDEFGDSVRRIDARGVVTTLAGQAGQRGYAAGRGTAAQFDGPSHAVRGPDGRIYVADRGNHAIRVIDADGRVGTFARKPAQGDDGEAELLGAPDALAFDARGRLWVTDEYADTVTIVTPDGHPHAWKGGSDEAKITALATDAGGQVWGATATRIGKLRDDGFETVLEVKTPEWQPPVAYRVEPPSDGPVAGLIGRVPFGGRGPLPPPPAQPPEFTPPAFNGLAVDDDGDVYVSESTRFWRLRAGQHALESLYKVDPDAMDMRDGGIQGLAVRHGEVFATVGGSGLYRLDAKHVPRPWSGAHRPWDDLSPQRQRPDFEFESDDTTLARRDGTLVFVDKLESFVGQARAGGEPGLLAGKPGEDGFEDGPGPRARFHYPSDLALDADGNVYVADSGNGSIRRIGPDGLVSTFAGTQATSDRADGVGGQARFWHPRKLAMDERAGLLYVVDDTPYSPDESTRLRVVTLKTGAVRSIRVQVRVRDFADGPDLADAAGAPEWIDKPDVMPVDDIAVGPGGMLYVLALKSVWRLDPASGRMLRFFSHAPDPDPPPTPQEPGAPALSDDDRENDVVACSTLWCDPGHIAVDATGHVYVSDSLDHTLVRIDPDGQAGVIAGRPGVRGTLAGPLPGGLDRPGGLAWAPDGSLLVNVDEHGVLLLHEPDKAPLRERLRNDG